MGYFITGLILLGILYITYNMNKKYFIALAIIYIVIIPGNILGVILATGGIIYIISNLIKIGEKNAIKNKY